MVASQDQNRLTVVPHEHRWLRALVAALGKAGLGVGDAVLADRTLRLDLAPGRPGQVQAVIRPRTRDVPSLVETRHFSVGYAGTGDLSADRTRSLRGLTRILARHEAHMPRDLPGHAAMVTARAGDPSVLGRAFPFVTTERSRADPALPWGDGGDMLEVLVRTTAACNQACPYCSAPQHATPSEQLLLACFRAVAEHLPGAMVSLTGGEPTLRPGFLAELTALLELDGIGLVQVQTNGLRFATGLDPADIPPDQRLSFFVSLHALDEAVYDRCTGTRGRLEEALAGVRRLLAAGHRVVVNVLVQKDNLEHLEDLVQRLPDTFSPAPALHLSTLICPEFNPRAQAHLVRFANLVPVLERAAALAQARGLDLHPLLSSSHASLPACQISPEARRAGGHAYRFDASETGYEDLSKPYTKAAGCRRCSQTGRCLGVPRAYAQAFGLDELTPVEEG